MPEAAVSCDFQKPASRLAEVTCHVSAMVIVRSS